MPLFILYANLVLGFLPAFEGSPANRQVISWEALVSQRFPADFGTRQVLNLGSFNEAPQLSYQFTFGKVLQFCSPNNAWSFIYKLKIPLCFS